MNTTQHDWEWRGEVRAQDYARALRATSLPSWPWRVPLTLLAFVLAYVPLLLLEDADIWTAIAFSAGLLAFSLVMTLVNAAFRRWIHHQDCYANLGPCSLHLEEDGLRLRGSTYDAFVPYSHIEAVQHEYDGWSFTVQASTAFALPDAEHTELGDPDTFMQELHQRVDAERRAVGLPPPPSLPAP